jgi:hypothetical protein
MQVGTLIRVKRAALRVENCTDDGPLWVTCAIPDNEDAQRLTQPTDVWARSLATGAMHRWYEEEIQVEAVCT